jgi:hypothetical protein
MLFSFASETKGRKRVRKRAGPQLAVAYHYIPIADWRDRTKLPATWFGSSNPQSEIRNPQSEILVEFRNGHQGHPV